MIQKRICRNYTFKDGTIKRGVFIALYIPNSQDEKWLRNAQQEADAVWLNSVDDVVNYLGQTLDGFTVTES